MNNKGLSDFISHLEKFGEVNHGVFSYVYAPKGKDYVYRAWTYDPGFDAYVNLIQKTKNEYFPVIEKIKEIPFRLSSPRQLQDEKVKIAKIEKLFPAKGLLFKPLCQVKRKGVVDDLSIYDIMNVCTSGLDVFSVYEVSDEDKQKYKPLADAFVLLHNVLANRTRINWDVQGSNIMLRANGHIVLSDPIGTPSNDTNKTLVDYGES